MFAEFFPAFLPKNAVISLQDENKSRKPVNSLHKGVYVDDRYSEFVSFKKVKKSFDFLHSTVRRLSAIDSRKVSIEV